MRNEVEQLLEKVNELKVGSEFIMQLDLSSSLNIDFDKKRIEMARGRVVAYEYVGGLIQDILKKA